MTFLRPSWLLSAVRNPTCPTEWPADMPYGRLKKNCRKYLLFSGWQPLPPWNWCDVQVRAIKDGQCLNLLVPYVREIRLQAMIREANDIAYKNHTIITFLTHGFRQAEIDAIECPCDVLLAGVHDLPNLVDLLARRRSSLVVENPRQVDPPRSSPVVAPIKGLVGSVSRTQIWGWAYSPAHPDEHVSIEVCIGEHVLATGRADMFRADLESAGFGSGDHAFSVKLPDSAENLPLSLIEVVAVSCSGTRQFLNFSERALTERDYGPRLTDSLASLLEAESTPTRGEAV